MTSRPDANPSLPERLRAEVADCGFYPSLVCHAVAGAVGGRAITHHLVHHEATFAGHEVHRHLTVLALIEGAMVICHADEAEHGRAIVTTEVVRLSAIDSVVLTQSVADPASRNAGLVEAWLTVIWGTARRIDLGPAGCDDPSCDADHGYTGMSTGEDYVVRMSRDADGPESMIKLVAFGARLQELVR